MQNEFWCYINLAACSLLHMKLCSFTILAAFKFSVMDPIRHIAKLKSLLKFQHIRYHIYDGILCISKPIKQRSHPVALLKELLNEVISTDTFCFRLFLSASNLCSSNSLMQQVFITSFNSSFDRATGWLLHQTSSSVMHHIYNRIFSLLSCTLVYIYIYMHH